MFFKRSLNAPPSDPYTSIPSQRSRRQSAPPQSHLAIATSAPLSASGTRFNETGSGIAGPSTLPADVTNGGGSRMARQRSRSVPYLREATARAAYGYGNGIGLVVRKRDSGLHDERSLAGRKQGSRHPRELELVDRINVQSKTAIPGRKPPSKFPTPTRIPGISISKPRFFGTKDSPKRPSETQHRDNGHSAQHGEGARQTHAPTYNPPHCPPNFPSRPQPHTRQKAAAPPVTARPWIRGQGVTQGEEKDERQSGHVGNEGRRVDGAETRGTTDVELERHRKRNIKRTTRRPIPIEKPNPGPLLRELAELLRQERYEVGDEIDVDDVLAMHERDVMDCAGREEWVDKRHGRKGTGEDEEETLTVFAAPLRQVYIYASTRTVFGTSSGTTPGWELDLPIVVVSCIEEVWRRGVFDIKLFTSLDTLHSIRPEDTAISSMPSVQRLINIFDSQRTSFGASYSLSTSNTDGHAESKTAAPVTTTEEILSLLRTYLSSLPEPIFSPVLMSAAWAWCVSPSEDVEGDDGRRVRVARILLRLLPSPNFALLVYLLAFLRQVTLSTSGNAESTSCSGDETAARAIGKVFGGWAFGYGENGIQGEEMILWFLVRWERICDGLFDIGVSGGGRGGLRTSLQCGGGVSLPRNAATPTGNEDRGRLAPWMPNDAPGDFFGTSPSMSSTEDLLFGTKGDLSAWADKHSGRAKATGGLGEPILSPHDDGHLGITTEDGASGDLMPSQGLFEMDKLSLMRATPSPGPSVSTDTVSMTLLPSGELRVDAYNEVKSVRSIDSGRALEERLMDVSFPQESEGPLGVLWHDHERPPETGQRGTSTSPSNVISHTPSRSLKLKSEPSVVPTETASISADDPISDPPSPAHLRLSQATAKIRTLKRELERSEIAVADAINETFKARERIALLENRVKELELDAESKDVEGNSGCEDIKVLEVKLDSALKERDEALELVKIVKQVIVGRTQPS